MIDKNILLPMYKTIIREDVNKRSGELGLSFRAF
jgi:hypothetical protein